MTASASRDGTLRGHRRRQTGTLPYDCWASRLTRIFAVVLFGGNVLMPDRQRGTNERTTYTLFRLSAAQQGRTESGQKAVVIQFLDCSAFPQTE
jgi:hypothetical protein